MSTLIRVTISIQHKFPDFSSSNRYARDIRYYWPSANGSWDRVIHVLRPWECHFNTKLAQVLKFNLCSFFRFHQILTFPYLFLILRPFRFSRRCTPWRRPVRQHGWCGQCPQNKTLVDVAVVPSCTIFQLPSNYELSKLLARVLPKH